MARARRTTAHDLEFEHLHVSNEDEQQNEVAWAVGNVE